MAIDTEFKNGLERERKRLTDLIRRARARIELIDQLLIPLDPPPEQLTLQAGDPPRHQRPLQTLGLRAAILKVLQDSRHPMTPQEITATLEQRGYESTGKTSLRLRVNSEMWRMGKANLIAKKERGTYVAVEG